MTERAFGRTAAGLLTLLAVVSCAAPPASPDASTAASATAAATASAATATPSGPSATPSPSGPPADVAFEPVFEDIVAPVGLVPAPEGGGRSFIVDQTGLIYVLLDGVRAERPFLDISARLVRLDRDYDERGLLGLAFHPDYADNGRFYVYYGTPSGPDDSASIDHLDTLSEFQVRADDPDLADVDSERVILQFGQPQPNHSGGALGFGPDGFLYLGTGDGGGQGDASPGHSAQGNAQDPDKLNGKLLRIDVVPDQPGADPEGAVYTIPDGNMFADGGGRPEIYAVGLRNPWRLSWEPDGDRRLLVSDVGYGRYEEVDVVEAGGNYGWRIREGAHCLDVAAPLDETTDCPDADAAGDRLIDPVIEYRHRDVGIAVVGGYVYRGTALPALRGRYVFGDYSADWTSNAPDPYGSLLVAMPGPSDSVWPWQRLTIAGDPLGHSFMTGMGEDAAGELYVMSRRQFGPIGETGRVDRIVPVP